MQIVSLFGITQAGRYADELESVERGERTLGANAKITNIKIDVRQDGGSPASFEISGGDSFSAHDLYQDIQALLTKYKGLLGEEISAWLAHAEGKDDGSHHRIVEASELADES